MSLFENSVETYQETSSRTTRQGTLGHSRLSSLSHWTNPGVQSEISVRKLISTLKKKKKAQAGNGLSNILPKSSHARKKKNSATTTDSWLKPDAYSSYLACD